MFTWAQRVAESKEVGFESSLGPCLHELGE